MNHQATGPGPADWLAAIIRGLHPLRWLAALIGLFATICVASLGQAIFFAQPPDISGWLAEPADHAQALGNEIAKRSPASVFIRLGPLLVVIFAIWSLVGAWIARQEVLARKSSGQYENVETPGPSATSLVIRQCKQLVLCCPLVFGVILLLSIPLLLAVGTNAWAGGVGALLVAILLPLVLLADLMLLAVLLGLIGAPLMPVTIAVENSDTFDALSRSFNYVYMRIPHYAVFFATSLALAAIPLATSLFLLSGPVANWPQTAGHPVVWIAAGLSISIFWSLQTVIYLHLRTAIDSVDSNEIAVDQPEVTPVPETADEKRENKPTRNSFVYNVTALALVVGSWFFTSYLLSIWGGENANWMQWGLGEKFVPEADGLYPVAALIAGIWGIICIGISSMMVFKSAFLSKNPADSTDRV